MSRYNKEYKKQRGEPKGRKYKCSECNQFTYIEGKKLENDQGIICDDCVKMAQQAIG